MQSGFLLGSKPSPTHQSAGRSEVISPAAGTQPQDTPEVAAAAAPPPPSRQLPTREQAEAGLAQCLELLKGPTDERRLVGGDAWSSVCPSPSTASLMPQALSCRPHSLLRCTPSQQPFLTQVCGSATGDQAAACGGRGHYPPRARRSGTHLPGPPASASQDQRSASGGAGGGTTGGGLCGSGPGCAGQLCACA